MTHTGATSTATAARRDFVAGRRGMVHVFDAEPFLANTLDLDALTDIDAGRVVVLARPGERNTTGLLRDLLTALGADYRGLGRPPDSEHCDVIDAWLLAHAVTDLLVVSAERLNRAEFELLVDRSLRAGLTLWLLSTPPVTDDWHTSVDAWAPDPISWARFAQLWADIPGLFRDPDQPAPGTTSTAPGQSAPGTSGPADAFPRTLPVEDFPTFRTACRRTITPAQFELVDAQLHRAADAADQLLDTLTTPTTGAASGTAPTEADLAAHLHARYRELPTDAEVLVETRGLQIAAFRRGWFVQVDTAGLLAAAADNPRPGSRTPAHWARLRTYPSPHRAAVCALAATDLDLAAITALRVDDVAPDGGTITVDGVTLPVEPGADLYLRAQRRLRLAHGARGSDPFLTLASGRPVAARTCADVINQARIDTGLAVTSRRVARERLTGDRWATRWGIGLQPLTDGAR